MNSHDHSARALEALSHSWPGAFNSKPPSGSLVHLAAIAAEELITGTSNTIDNLFRDMDSPSPTYIWNPESDCLREPSLAFLNDYWTQKAAGNTLPLSDCIDPLDLVPALGNVMLLEPIDNEVNFRYRIYGTKIVDYSKIEMTGKTVWDIPAPLVATYFVSTYLAVVKRREPLHIQHYARLHHYFARWQRIILPFVDTKGVINRLLVGNTPHLESAND